MSLENEPLPDKVTILYPSQNQQCQRRAFDSLTADVHAARAKELKGGEQTGSSSEELLHQLMTTPALDGDQLGVKLRLFAVELAKEAEFGQNPDFRLIPFFADIQRDCIRLLHASCDEAAD